MSETKIRACLVQFAPNNPCRPLPLLTDEENSQLQEIRDPLVIEEGMEMSRFQSFLNSLNRGTFKTCVLYEDPYCPTYIIVYCDDVYGWNAQVSKVGILLSSSKKMTTGQSIDSFFEENDGLPEFKQKFPGILLFELKINEILSFQVELS